MMNVIVCLNRASELVTTTSEYEYARSALSDAKALLRTIDDTMYDAIKNSKPKKYKPRSKKQSA